MTMRKLAILLVISLFASLSSISAKAELSEIMVLFIKADRNGDQVLSQAEVLMVALQQFGEVDSDRDGSIESQELDEIKDDPEFADNDSDKSGSLSISEVVQEKLADFKSADTNGDGQLTLEEVTKAYEEKN